MRLLNIMNKALTARLFCYIGHSTDHLFMLLYPTAVLAMGASFEGSYAELLALATPGYIAFGAGSIPAGWLGDKWRATTMLAIFFIGTGLAAIFTGFAESKWHLGIGLTLIGLFASIYHPVGMNVLVANAEKLGKSMGLNGMSGSLGTAAAPAVAGFCTDMWGWRAAFFAPGAVAIGIGIAFLCLVSEAQAKTPQKTHRTEGDVTRRTLIRVFSFLAIAVMCNGLIYNATSVSLPELFQEKLTGQGSALTQIGLLVTVVYSFAAFAQLLIGHLIDQYRLRTVLITVLTMQVPFLFFLSQASGWPLLPAAIAAVFLNIGSIPIADTLIARYCTETWRATVYGVKFVFSLGVSALAVPLVSYMHALGGSTAPLFAILSGGALVIAVASIVLPRKRASASPVPASTVSEAPPQSL